jgi:hypothetical protein
VLAKVIGSGVMSDLLNVMEIAYPKKLIYDRNYGIGIVNFHTFIMN